MLAVGMSLTYLSFPFGNQEEKFRRYCDHAIYLSVGFIIEPPTASASVFSKHDSIFLNQFFSTTQSSSVKAMNLPFALRKPAFLAAPGPLFPGWFRKGTV